MSEDTNTPNGDSKKNFYETNKETIEGILGTCCIDMNIVENNRDLSNALESDTNLFESINEIRKNGIMSINVEKIGKPVQYEKNNSESLRNALKLLKDMEVPEAKRNFFEKNNMALKIAVYNIKKLEKAKQEAEKLEENKGNDDRSNE